MGDLNPVNPSLWVTTTRDDSASATTTPLPEGAAYDVVVIGAGITGLSTALLLAERGARVAVLEADRVCSGVTAFTTAKVTSLHGLKYAQLARNRGEDAARAYAAANEWAIGQVAEWIGGYDIACDFSRRAAYTYTTERGRVADVEAEVETAQRVGLAAELVTDIDLPFPVQAAIRVDDQAQFHPRHYCLGLAAAVVRLGGEIYEGLRVTGVDAGSPCRVKVGDVVVSAPTVVLATLLPVLDRGVYFARTHPERSYAMTLRTEGELPTGMYLSADQPTRSVRTAAGDSLLLVGGEGHKVGQDADTRQRYAAIEDWARSQWKVADVDHRWSAQDYVPVDGTPYVGPQLPGSPVLVATGFAKWGMTNGTVAARLIADRIGGLTNEWSGAFDSGRFANLVTSKATYTENVDAVAGHLIGDRLKTLNPPDASTLAPGEGGIVTHDGDKVAAYRHDDGTLTAVSPVCRHVGCLVAFNTAERTWDCPCHGSRYTVDGRLIQGPAVHDLERKTP